MDQLNKCIEKKFGINIQDSQVLKKDGHTYVSKILADNDKIYAVKSGYLPEERQDFIVQTENLLSQKGVSLARPVPDQNGNLYFKFKGAPYVLYHWVKGRAHPLSTLSDLKALIQAIAHLHRASYGLKYPKRTRIFIHKDKATHYLNQIKSMEKFEKIHFGTTDDKIKEILAAIPFFKKIASKALQYLHKSHYASYYKKSYAKLSLVHGDAHQGNILWNHPNSSFIDFEDVRFDLPSVDIMRVYSKFTKRRDFDPKTFENILHWYEEVNPLHSPTRKIFLIDCLFPHPFARLVRLRKFEHHSLQTIRHLIEQEKSKVKYIYQTYFHKAKKK